MNDENSSSSYPDSRISALRVRLRRMNSGAEVQEVLCDLLSIGQAAGELVPDLIQRISPLMTTDTLCRLIKQLKSQALLTAADRADIHFQPYQQAEFLEAGFSEFEQPLVDYLWQMKDTGPTGLYESVLNALGKYGRLRETLETLEALRAELAQKLKVANAKRYEEERRIEMAEMDVSDVAESWIDLVGLRYFHDHIQGAVGELRGRPLEEAVMSKSVILPLQEKESPKSVQEIISLGESQTLEFKSTLRWDLREGTINKKLEEVIMKTVAAFANSQGGTLLIGVSDDREVLGLESDYHSLGGADRDKFELHLRNLLNQQFGVGFVSSKVVIKFHEVEEKEVCQIETAAAKEPVILKVKDKNGQPTERFYARSGNSSQEIPLSEMNAYIKERFHS